MTTGRINQVTIGLGPLLAGFTPPRGGNSIAAPLRVPLSLDLVYTKVV